MRWEIRDSSALVRTASVLIRIVWPGWADRPART